MKSSLLVIVSAVASGVFGAIVQSSPIKIADFEDDAIMDDEINRYVNDISQRDPEAMTRTAFKEFSSQLDATNSAPVNSGLYYLTFLEQWEKMLQESVKVIETSKDPKVKKLKATCKEALNWPQYKRISQITKFSEIARSCGKVAFPNGMAMEEGEEEGLEMGIANMKDVMQIMGDPFWFDNFLKEVNKLPNFDAVNRKIEETSGWQLFKNMLHFYLMGKNTGNVIKTVLRDIDLSGYAQLEMDLQEMISKANSLKNPFLMIGFRSYISKTLRMSWLSVGLAMTLEKGLGDKINNPKLLKETLEDLHFRSLKSTLEPYLLENFVKYYREY